MHYVLRLYAILPVHASRLPKRKTLAWETIRTSIPCTRLHIVVKREIHKGENKEEMELTIQIVGVEDAGESIYICICIYM